MSEPVHRQSQRSLRAESSPGHGEAFAADVLLIADTTIDRQANGRGNGSAGDPPEPLDMENVVRKLIALLSEPKP